MNAEIEQTRAQIFGIFQLRSAALERLSTPELRDLASECARNDPNEVFTIRMAREITGIAATKVMEERR